MENTLTIHIESFDGPFDLLYFLIQKNKMDIYDIPVTKITEQYLDYLFNTEHMNMEAASEFLVMASTLLHIKSRILLPRYEPEEEGADDKIDSREELIMRLVEYKKFRELSHKLRQLSDAASLYVYKYPERISFKKSVDPGTHNVYELWSLYENLVEAININLLNTREKMRSIRTREKISVADKMKDIMNSLIKKAKVIFSELFCNEKSSKLEIVAGFVAMLELSRLNRVRISQKALFDKIVISRKEKKQHES